MSEIERARTEHWKRVREFREAREKARGTTILLARYGLGKNARNLSHADIQRHCATVRLVMKKDFFLAADLQCQALSIEKYESKWAEIYNSECPAHLLSLLLREDIPQQEIPEAAQPENSKCDADELNELLLDEVNQLPHMKMKKADGKDIRVKVNVRFIK